MVSKMILRLGFVDLADHAASLIFTQPVALSELSIPSGRARPYFQTYRFPNASSRRCVVENGCM